MGKKSKKKKQKETVPVKKTKKPFLGIGIAVLVVVAFLIVSGIIPLAGAKKGKSFYVQGGENRPTLDPAQFIGRVEEAYAAAKNSPEVLDEAYCYCSCDEPPFYHKSLLSCFVDKHAAG